MLRVRGWGKFQHYKERRPPWIKLSRELLENYDWYRLQDASKALAVTIWLLAAENDDPASGTIKDDPEWLGFRARMDQKLVIECVKDLLKHGFIEHVQTNDSDLLAPCYQDAIPETETETETETDKKNINIKKRNLKKNAQRIPADWDCDIQLGKWALEQGISREEVIIEIDNFKDHWTAASGATARKHDWDAAFRTWIRNTAKWKKPK